MPVILANAKPSISPSVFGLTDKEFRGPQQELSVVAARPKTNTNPEVVTTASAITLKRLSTIFRGKFHVSKPSRPIGWPREQDWMKIG
jgi:hypothetical protein